MDKEQQKNNEGAQKNTTIENKNEIPLKKDQNLSSSTKERANAAKNYIEKKYSKLLKQEQEQKEYWELLQTKMAALNFSLSEQELIKRDIIHKEAERQRQKRQKITARDFESLAIIGRGAFGEVRLCKNKSTKEIIAIKKMKKQDMIYKNQVGHIRAERDVLASVGNPWIVELKCSFQDEKFLYLVMEYLGGGDLMTLLMKKDILTEEESKFYIAELILAVHSVHKMNYIHRDLKPDNILIDNLGHLKLSDFGLCKNTEIQPKQFDLPKLQALYEEKNPSKDVSKKPFFRRNRKLAYSTVGTPDYIAPEVFMQTGYSETVDWWSVGVILFEMLVGYPPFFSDDPSTTCQKILHWRKTLAIPPEANLSPQAIDLLRRLLTDANERLGINGVEEIKAHPFFAGIEWKKIREKKTPFVPTLKSEIDHTNFDHYDEEEPWIVEDNGKPKRTRKEAHFIGYTFKRDVENERSTLVTALEELENIKQSMPRAGSPTTINSIPMFNAGSRSMSPPTQKKNLLNTGGASFLMNTQSQQQQQQIQQQQQQQEIQPKRDPLFTSNMNQTGNVKLDLSSNSSAQGLKKPIFYQQNLKLTKNKLELSENKTKDKPQLELQVPNGFAIGQQQGINSAKNTNNIGQNLVSGSPLNRSNLIASKTNIGFGKPSQTTKAFNNPLKNFLKN